jgi:hypothetical protein
VVEQVKFSVSYVSHCLIPNRKVFGKTRAIPLNSVQLEKFSVPRMSSQRAVHEGGSP